MFLCYLYLSKRRAQYNEHMSLVFSRDVIEGMDMNNTEGLGMNSIKNKYSGICLTGTEKDLTQRHGEHGVVICILSLIPRKNGNHSKIGYCNIKILNREGVERDQAAIIWHTR